MNEDKPGGQRWSSWLNTNPRFWVALALFILALIVRLLSASPIATGDEIATFEESINIGQNVQGLPYYLINNIWLQFSDDVLWVRLLVILIGSLVPALCWVWLHAWRSSFVALATALLLVVSPLAIQYSLFIRFYALYFLAAIFFFWAYTRVAFQTEKVTRRDYGLLVIAAALLLVSQALGFVVIGLTMLHWMLCNPKRVPRWLWVLIAIGLVAVVIVMIVSILSPDTLNVFFKTMLRVAAAQQDDYEGPRGWSLVAVAKLGLLFHIFVFGGAVYPLDLWIVGPGLLLVVLFAGVGVYRLFREKIPFALYFVVMGIAGIVAVYLIFDPLLPPGFWASADPRLVLWVLPIFLWVIVEGIQASQRLPLRYLVFAVLLATQLYGVWKLNYRDWASVDYDAIFQTLAELEDYGDQAAIVRGGRASEIDFNLKTPAQLFNLWDYSETADAMLPLTDTYRIIAIANSNEKDEFRCRYRQALQPMVHYQETTARVDYPFFLYVYDLEAVPAPGTVPLPRSFYHPVLADLSLPQPITWQAQTYSIGGAFELPDCEGQSEWTSDIAESNTTDGLLLLSHTLWSEKIDDGAVIARLIVTSRDNDQHVFEIKQGQQTQLWKQEQCGEGCQSIYSWTKRSQLRGFSAYPDANSQFEAHIWGTELAFAEPVDVESVQIEMLEPDVTLNIWGLHLLNGTD